MSMDYVQKWVIGFADEIRSLPHVKSLVKIPWLISVTLIHVKSIKYAPMLMMVTPVIVTLGFIKLEMVKSLNAWSPQNVKSYRL